MNKNFVPLKEIPGKYEAYLYLVVFDHDKTKKYYLGYHVGLFDGTYKGTPITHEQEFFEDLGKYDYKIYALDFGNADKMITKEKIMLDDIKKTRMRPEPDLPKGWENTTIDLGKAKTKWEKYKPKESIDELMDKLKEDKKDD